MLSALYIQNVAVIQKATIDFIDGLNVFTGETGAGKTVLINAINALLGERTPKDLIRTGQEKAIITGLFRKLSPVVIRLLAELGYTVESDEELMIQREIGTSSNTCKINGLPATVAMLKSIGGELINIHGQQDNQMLASAESHRRFIDSFSKLETELTAYAEVYHQMQKAYQELSALHMDESYKAQRIDILNYQIREIEAAALTAGEEEALTTRLTIVKNAERIIHSLSEAKVYLDGDDDREGAVGLLDGLAGQLRAAARYIDTLSGSAEKVDSMRYELEEQQRQVRELLDSMDFDAGELDQIGSRLDFLYRLKKKYGASVAEIIIFGEKAKAELDTITFSEERQKEAQKRYNHLHEKAVKLSAVLTQRRREGGKLFTERLREELSQLDMPSVRLTVAISVKELSPDGADRLEFLISTNPGEEPKPLSKIASGGEISRTMLAIKSVLADCEDIDTLIFDEVDAGVSGRAAQRIGAKLKGVAKARQVICVTHLAQVAAFADNHLLIEKLVEGDRTFTQVRTLDRDGRVKELARIMGGERLTELSLKNADEMLTLAAERY